jgi:MOSC domain-containing protein YiiM
MAQGAVARAPVDPAISVTGIDAPNLRPGRLIHAELHDELMQKGIPASAGQMGEDITTRGVDLLGLPAGARLYLGETAVVEVIGLRNPCAQLDVIWQG